MSPPSTGAPDRPRGRRRSRHRPRARARRRAGHAAGGDARQFQAAQARPAGDRHRQPARLRVDGHDRRDLGARPLAAGSVRAADRRRDPDRRGAQSRQFRRPAGVARAARSWASTPPSSWARRGFALRWPPTRRILCSASWCATATFGAPISGSRRSRPQSRAGCGNAAGVTQTAAWSRSDRARQPGGACRCATGDIILALDGVAISGADDLIRCWAGTRSVAR